jgi:hypothetical protein
LAPRSRRPAAVERLGTLFPEDSIPATRLTALALAAIAGVVPPCLQAQEQSKKEELNRAWQIEGLHAGFCVQLLIDPRQLDVAIPRGARPLRADAMEDLNPVLRTVISSQPEFAAWTPSGLCLYYMETVDVGSLRVSERDPSKAPMIGVWALAAADAAGGARKDVVLRMFTNTGRLERAGQVNGLDLRKVRSTVRDIHSEDSASAPPIGVRYQLRLGKSLLTWDGRRVSDSTRANGPQSNEWRADSRRRGPMTARLTLTPEWTKAMVGSLWVEGDDDFANAIKASPIRFVGPAVQGGGGELAFGR